MVALRWLQPLRVVAAWLRDDASCPPAARRLLSSLAFAMFIALVIVGVAHHQIWRDEARALTIALEPASWSGLAAALENEGHPGLWYLLLRVAHGVVPSPNVLQGVTAAVGIGAAVVVFCRAPLPTWWRVGFLFGWVPLFEGAVLCRNYGISMLLVYGFCSAVAGGVMRPVVAASLLALLANTNVYGTMMAGGFALFLAVECRRRRLSALVVATVVLVAGAGIAVSVWTTWPTAASKIVSPESDALRDVFLTGLRAMVGFSVNTGTLFGFAPLAWPVVLLALVATMGTPHLAIAVLAVFGCAAWFMRGIYGAGPHHLGMLFVFLAAVTWLRAGLAATAPTRAAQVAWRALLFGVWPLLLLFQGYRGLREIHHEVQYTKTSAPELARLLERDNLADAVLIGEPDYYLDALPNYVDNRIFIAREGRFGRRVSWTTANQRDMDLGQLLAAARALPRDGAPVLFVIGQPIDLGRHDREVIHGYGDRFHWSVAQHANFLAATVHVASLPARPGRFRGDERYEVYRLRE